MKQLILCSVLVLFLTGLGNGSIPKSASPELASQQQQYPLKEEYFNSVFMHTPPDEWNITLGTYGYCSSVCQTNDNGYIVTGFSSGDIFLVKLTSFGELLWEKRFGGKGTDRGMCVQPTSDDGYILTGFTQSFGAGEDDVWLIKTDYEGKEEWNATFGGRKLDYGWCCEQTLDGGYIVLGSTKSFVEEKNDYWLLKTDPLGREEWNYTYGGIGWDLGKAVQQTRDGGYIVTGLTDVSPDGSHQVDVGLIKIDSEGHQLWHKTYGDSIMQDGGLSVRQTAEGGYIIVGSTGTYPDSSVGGDIWLIKTDADGDVEWDTVFGGFQSEVGHSVWETNDGGYIVLGETDSFGSGKTDLVVLKTDSQGNEVWHLLFGGSRDDTVWGQGCRSIQQTSDGGYIAVGSTESQGGSLGPKPWIIKLSEPMLHIDVTGGFCLSAVIRNLHTTDRVDLVWTIEIDGGIVVRPHVEGMIDLVPAGDTQVIKARLFGFGKVVIRVTADGVGTIVHGFLIGPLIII